MNERLARCHRHPYLFKGFGTMLSHALHMYWRDRYGVEDTLARMRFSVAPCHIAEGR
jgi:hypothetical protein